MTDQDLSRFLENAAGWRVESGALTKVFTFPSFPAAVAFVDRVAAAAEQNQHHPDIDIRLNRVRLGLITHDAGRITARDMHLAAEADRLV